MFKAIVQAVRGGGGEAQEDARPEHLDARILQYDILEFVRSYQQERASN
jgi:hypothetical protein